MPKYTKVKSVDHLFNLVTEGNHHFFIQLNFGARSSKYITLGEEEGTLEIENEIDGTTQVLTASEIMVEANTLIGKAISYGSFWMEHTED